jgi:hypothetical protein
MCVVGDGLLRIALPGAQEGGFALGPAVTENIKTHRFDPGTREWIALKEYPLTDSGQGTTITRCQGGQAVVLKLPDAPAATEVLWFEPEQGAWSEAPAVPEPLTNATPALAGDTRVLWTSDRARNYYLLEGGTSEWGGTAKPVAEEATAQSAGDKLILQFDGPTVTELSVLEPKTYADAKRLNS